MFEHLPEQFFAVGAVAKLKLGQRQIHDRFWIMLIFCKKVAYVNSLRVAWHGKKNIEQIISYTEILRFPVKIVRKIPDGFILVAVKHGYPAKNVVLDRQRAGHPRSQMLAGGVLVPADFCHQSHADMRIRSGGFELQGLCQQCASRFRVALQQFFEAAIAQYGGGLIGGDGLQQIGAQHVCNLLRITLPRKFSQIFQKKFAVIRLVQVNAGQARVIDRQGNVDA
ncbi:hypothetical protein SDC9_50671 [bioreactor metagenome]|uniref:Uncharacterized protein n=1 Tax=bioreactor metagenome TaxID=1076179 RepID=A0A644WQ46_9ZZZZ